MKHKKIIIIPLMLLLSGAPLIEVSANFKKFKSSTKLTPQQEETVNEDQTSNENQVAESINTQESENKKFGRSNKISSPEVKKDDVYATLNPDTGFGPDVVTNFNFSDTDLLDLTRHMQKLTGINLILDKDIKGKISITAPTPITVGDAWKAYLTALNLNGYTMIKSGAFYKIVKSTNARNYPSQIYTGNYTPDTENYVMRIIPVKNINAAEITRNFRQFMSTNGRIIDLRQTNTILIYETGAMINNLVKLITFLDVPGHDESLQIIKVENSSAQEIAKLLGTLLQSGGKGRGAAPISSSKDQNISKIIAEPRTNSIIAMANAEGAAQLKELIHKLDVKLISKGNDKIHVYYLNYGDAETLSKTLSALVSNGGSASAGGATRITSKDDSGPLFTSSVKITADKANNALVVMAAPTDYLTIQEIIAKLDIPRQQVYVEGLIMETNVENSNQFGIKLLGVYGAGNAKKIGSTPGGGTALVDLLSNNLTNLSGFFYGLGLGRSIDVAMGDGKTVQVNSVNGIIKALASDNNNNVLSTPQLMILDNEDGLLEVGETVPTLVRETAANGSSVNTPSDQKVAITLKITPQINKVTRMVKLKIDQKVADFSGKFTDSQIGVGTVNRQAVTTIIVRDRDTISMGGLMRDKTTDSVSKVPLLGDIPVLGWLFKEKNQVTTKVNLLFFLTPKIMAPYEKQTAMQVKESLGRRAEHLKDVFGKDDPNASTVRGLYEKANRQQEGPLFDESDTPHYIKESMRTEDVPEYAVIAKSSKEELKEEKKIIQEKANESIMSDNSVSPFNEAISVKK